MDILGGQVINVLDGDTFDLDVDEVGEDNDYDYSDVERIRLRGVNAPELDEPGGRAALARLRAEIAGQRVRVGIHARDRFGRLVSDVKKVR